MYQIYIDTIHFVFMVSLALALSHSFYLLFTVFFKLYFSLLFIIFSKIFKTQIYFSTLLAKKVQQKNFSKKLDKLFPDGFLVFYYLFTCPEEE